VGAHKAKAALLEAARTYVACGQEGPLIAAAESFARARRKNRDARDRWKIKTGKGKPWEKVGTEKL
jgi:hypothetical protein